MSPAAACSISTRFRPSKANSLVTFVCCDRAVELQHRHRVVQLHRAVEDAADRDAPEVVAGVEVGDQHLQRRRRDRPRGGGTCSTMASNSGRRSSPGVARSRRRHALARVGVEHRELDLLLGGVEVDEQVVDLVQHFLRARVRRGRSC